MAKEMSKAIELYEQRKKRLQERGEKLQLELVDIQQKIKRNQDEITAAENEFILGTIHSSGVSITELLERIGTPKTSPVQTQEPVKSTSQNTLNTNSYNNSTTTFREEKAI